jgi:hypothetical protein
VGIYRDEYSKKEKMVNTAGKFKYDNKKIRIKYIVKLIPNFLKIKK